MKNRNIKSCLCILSVICCLSAVQVYAQESSYSDKYLKEAVEQQKTDNITPEYLNAVEIYFYNLIDKGEYKEALDTVDYLISANKSLFGEYSSRVGYAYVGKARYYMHLAIYNLAKQNMDKAFEIYQKNIDDSDIKSNSIYSYIQFYSTAEMPYEVLKYLDMLTIKELNPPTLAQKYLEYGDVYAQIKNYDKAIDYYNKYHKENLKSDENSNLTNFTYYMRLASLYENKIYYQLFNDYLIKAEEELKNIEDSDKSLRISFNMHRIRYFMDTNNYDKAKKLLDETKCLTDKYGQDYHKENIKLAYLDYYKDIKDITFESYVNKIKKLYKPYTSNSLQFLRYAEKQIDMYRAYGLLEDADKTIQNALKEISKVKDCMPSLYAKYLKKAFELELQRNNPEKAKYYLDKSFEIYSKILPETAIEFSELYCNYAELSQREGNIQEAINYYDKAIKINSNLQGEKHRDIANIYDNLSNIYLNLGESEKAIDYMDKAIEIYKISYGENHIQVYDKLINKYHLYNNIGEETKAKALFENINKDFENNIVKGQSIDISYRLNINNGYIELSNENYEKALEYAKKAMTYAKLCNKKRCVYGLLYNIYKESGKSVKAYKYKKLGHIEQ